jgi:hypothetical protein
VHVFVIDRAQTITCKCASLICLACSLDRWKSVVALVRVPVNKCEM